MDEDQHRDSKEPPVAPPNSTRREVSQGLEQALFTHFPVLDHGFVRIVDYMGNDTSIVQAARVSYGRGTKTLSEDRALIHYLMRHRHTTPFEMADIKIHVKLPIFVARQWIRHRTASVNEYSARYSILDREFYVPAPEQIASQSATNKQGRGQAATAQEAAWALDIIKNDALRSYENYLELLNINDDGSVREVARKGLARELARMNLPVGFYTQWYWKTNLHNLMGFLRLRADAHAQYEIRAYAEVLLKLMEAWVPMTYSAFVEHQLHAVTLSATAMTVVRRMLAGEHVTEENSGLSHREWHDLQSQITAK